MADLTVDGLTELTAVANNDEIGIWDVSAAQYKKITQANLVGAQFTGGGTIATGGYTLTVPATGTAALLGTANVFTANQTITAAGARLTLTATSGIPSLLCTACDNGSSYGPFVWIERNNNASTPSAGFLAMRDKGNDMYYVWPDDAGNLRIHTVILSNANDTAGTVVGAQTSMAAAKYLYSELSPMEDVLRRIADGADAVRTFVYRSGAYNREKFEGVVTDYAPQYGVDRDAEHPAGKSLNEIQIAGDLLRAVAWLSKRMAELEARLTPGAG